MLSCFLFLLDGVLYRENVISKLSQHNERQHRHSRLEAVVRELGAASESSYKGAPDLLKFSDAPPMVMRGDGSLEIVLR